MKRTVLRALAGLAAAAACLTLGPHARAADPQYTGPFTWDPAWRRFRSSEYALTGVLGVADFAIYFYVPGAKQPHWTGGIFLDDILRDSLRARTPEGRHAARTASDITALSSMGWVIAIDSMIVPIARRSADVAGQLTSLDAEAFAFSLLVSNLTSKLVGRARPSYADCHHNPLFEPLCNSSITASFPSGHTTAAFTAAGLSCAHHLHAGLYGNLLADRLACAGEISLAAATGTLRVVGDRHYATDVWMGAVIGFALGYGLPTLFHYGKVRSEAPSAQAGQTLMPSVPFAPSISGTF